MHSLASKALFDKGVTFPDALVADRGWRLVSTTFPLLDVIFEAPQRVPLRLQFQCADWNDLPPSIILLDAAGNFSLPNGIPQFSAGVINPGPHPQTGRPFICMRGAREYHQHPSHATDLWEPLRGNSAYELGGIVTQIWRAWRDPQR